MENIGTWDKNSVINELTQGKELANELKKQLNPTKITSSKEACDFLMEKIVSSYDNALALLNCMALLGDNNQNPCHEIMWENPKGSTTSEGSNPGFDDQSPKTKKRKKIGKWSEQVRVCSEKGSEGHLGDGYNWRKYGQKDILGANHPRAYYRCTHRHTQGCLATKQVQRADDDSSIFEVIYRGKHSCMQERQVKQNQAEKDQTCIQQVELKIETQELETKEENFSPFPPTENVVTQMENFIGTSPFLSPETSELYFSLSQQNDFADFAEIISNPTPLIRNFSFGEFDFSLIDHVDFSSHVIDTFQ